MKPITVLFFGSQGAGKGTQVQMLMDFLKSKSDRKIIHLDMGKEFRALRDSGSYAGKRTGEIIDVGGRMPDFMAIYVQTKKIAESFTGEEHIVGDGLARGPEQTAAYDDAMQFFGRDNDFQIINLVINDDTAVKRLLARGRNDDTEEGIRNRLNWYKSDVVPQLEMFKERGRTIHTIDGQPDEKIIHQNILKALELDV